MSEKMIARPESWDAIGSVAAYCGSSILMTVTNKYVLSGLDYNLNFLLLAVQSVVCVLAIHTGKHLSLLSYRDYNSKSAKQWFPVSLLLIVMIYTSTKALRYLSIPVYTIFKNLTIILTAYSEVIFLGGGPVTRLALFSFGLIVLSSVVAAWADIQHVLTSTSQADDALSTLNAGYIWMMMNCISTAAYLVGMRIRIKTTGFTDFETMFYNNFLTIPVLLVCTFVIEDWSFSNILRNFPVDSRNTIIAAMVFSGLSTVFISYSSAWCVRATSSTTYSMVGALNKLPIAISGLVFFNAPVTFGSVTAIAIGFVSGVVYTASKVLQSMSTAAKKDISILPLTNQSPRFKDALKASSSP